MYRSRSGSVGCLGNTSELNSIFNSLHHLIHSLLFDVLFCQIKTQINKHWLCKCYFSYRICICTYDKQHLCRWTRLLLFFSSQFRYRIISDKPTQQNCEGLFLSGNAQILKKIKRKEIYDVCLCLVALENTFNHSVINWNKKCKYYLLTSLVFFWHAKNP